MATLPSWAGRRDQHIWEGNLEIIIIKERAHSIHPLGSESFVRCDRKDGRLGGFRNARVGREGV